MQEHPLTHVAVSHNKADNSKVAEHGDSLTTHNDPTRDSTPPLPAWPAQRWTLTCQNLFSTVEQSLTVELGVMKLGKLFCPVFYFFFMSTACLCLCSFWSKTGNQIQLDLNYQLITYLPDSKLSQESPFNENEVGTMAEQSKDTFKIFHQGCFCICRSVDLFKTTRKKKGNFCIFDSDSCMFSSLTRWLVEPHFPIFNL